jgi:pantothenate kinase-related protein Tda10
VPSEITKLFLQYGLLGAVAILALLYGWRKDREAKAAAEAWQERIDKQSDEHQAEMTKLADRYISKAESWSAQYNELARELKVLIDSILSRRQ